MEGVVGVVVVDVNGEDVVEGEGRSGEELEGEGGKWGEEWVGREVLLEAVGEVEEGIVKMRMMVGEEFVGGRMEVW